MKKILVANRGEIALRIMQLIDDRHRYTLRATIRLEGELLFSSTEHIPPFQDGKVEILVRRSSGP